MKFKILLLTVTLFTFSLSSYAKPLIDSVGVKNNDGKEMILFKVKAKDTYYSIGRRYDIKPEVLMKFNGHKKATLSIGSVVEVPTDKPFKKSSKGKEKAEEAVKETKKEKKERLEREAKEKKHERKEQAENTETTVAEQPEAIERVVPSQPVQQAEPENTSAPIQYKVSAGETLYAISKRFNTSVSDLTKLNNLSSNTLIPGQVLLVRSGNPTAAPVAQPPAFVNNTPQTSAHDSNSVAMINKDSSNAAERHLSANRFGLYEKNEKGVATWIDDPSLDPNKKLVLHRTAPIGTVVKITNPMTNRTTFAKVVGSFTDNETNKDVIIIMTKNVADSLGALDKRFRVDISYGSPNE